jgi:hypothetical protein
VAGVGRGSGSLGGSMVMAQSRPLPVTLLGVEEAAGKNQ